jgi:hypothetical protein
MGSFILAMTHCPLSKRQSRALSVRTLFAKWFAAVLFLLLGIGAGVWIGKHHEMANTAVTSVFQSTPEKAFSAGPISTSTVTSATPALTSSTALVSVVSRLQKEASAALQSGDLVDALARLEEISQGDPKNAEVLAETAIIYESIPNVDKSNEAWRKIQEIGPSAGPLYDLANMKFRPGVIPSAAAVHALDEKAAELMNQAGRAFLSATQPHPWKTNIVTAVFWIGGKGSEKSVWDENWTNNYGGLDNPEPSARHNYVPTAFIPKQNPFYCALPYNDLTQGQFKPEAPLVIPWFKEAYTGPGQSVCWHRWLAIRKGDRTCYAQWEDCGPVLIDHFQYVFGDERPNQNLQHGAGLNVSPAVRDYLGLQPTDLTDWQFVEVRDVPSGPWRDYGDNNPFVIAHRNADQNVQQQSAQRASATPTP